jgi:hypothetical protein
LMKEAGLQGRVVQVTRRQPGRRRFNAKGKIFCSIWMLQQESIRYGLLMLPT